MSCHVDNLSELALPCFNDVNGSECPDFLTECFSREKSSACEGNVYSDRYDNPSAAWVVQCAILMFFMKAGFLYVEQAFSVREPHLQRRVVLTKYIDIFGGTIGFWLFGYAISGNTGAGVLGEAQDYIFWFFRFTFATNTATILGGTLVGQKHVHMRAPAIFLYSFVMTAFIHPFLARIFWSSVKPDPRALILSPYDYCNGTFVSRSDHVFSFPRNESDTKFAEVVFVDFAGAGLVHLCGGIGAFVLSVFHKLESSDRVKCKWHKQKTGEELIEETVVLGRDEEEQLRNEEANNAVTRFFNWMYPSGGGEERLIDTAALGILILWTTWFAFNAGSAESISGKTVHAAVGRIALTMCLVAASAGSTQTIVSGLVQFLKGDETFNHNEIANAVIGGLVSVTACCPFVEPEWAILIGVLTVVFYHIGCIIEYALGLHDGARVFPVHAMCGFWGLLCVGIFSKACFIRELYEDVCFCVSSELPMTLDTHGLRFVYQIFGAAIITVWSIVMCAAVFLLLWICPVRIFTFWYKYNKFRGSLLFTHFNEIESQSDRKKRRTETTNSTHRRRRLRQRPRRELMNNLGNGLDNTVSYGSLRRVEESDTAALLGEADSDEN